MKQVLFVIPDLGCGGTNPSLEALYSHLKNYYKITVFALVHQPRSRSYLFDEVLLPADINLSLLFANFHDLSGLNQLRSFVIKSLNILLRLFHVDLSRCICVKAVRRLELASNYDTIVAYQEGRATQFVSLFHILNKVAWVHCNYDQWRSRDYSEQVIYCSFCHIVCVSAYTASVFSNRYPLLKNRVIGVHNFIESESIIKLGNERIDDASFNNDKFTILSVGRFHSIKQFHEIPQIASILKTKGVDFNWYILGEGYDKKEVKLFVDNLNKFQVSHNVKWLGGKSNPYPFFKHSDLYVCTSKSEACPMVFIEAKIFGVPIVTTDFPSSYEFIINNVTGIITPMKDMSDVLFDVITSKTKYIVIKNNVSNFVFDNNTQFSKLETIL